MWIFPLELEENAIPVDSELLEYLNMKRAKKIQILSDEQIKRGTDSGQKMPGKRKSSTINYERNQYVIEYAKRRANGVCQLCECDAPFQNKKGEPYLEVHHIEWLSQEGSDTIDNVAALCPNCHRKMHTLNRKEDIKKLRKDKTKSDEISFCFIFDKKIRNDQEKEKIDINGSYGVSVHEKCIDDVYYCAGCGRHTMDEGDEGCSWSDCIEDREELDEDGNEIEY